MPIVASIPHSFSCTAGGGCHSKLAQTVRTYNALIIEARHLVVIETGPLSERAEEHVRRPGSRNKCDKGNAEQISYFLPVFVLELAFRDGKVERDAAKREEENSNEGRAQWQALPVREAICRSRVMEFRLNCAIVMIKLVDHSAVAVGHRDGALAAHAHCCCLRASRFLLWVSKRREKR